MIKITKSETWIIKLVGYVDVCTFSQRVVPFDLKRIQMIVDLVWMFQIMVS